MISFATTGPDESAPCWKLQSQRVPLTQHWIRGGQLAGPSLIPQAGFDLRPDGMLVFTASMKPGAQDKFQAGPKEFVEDLWKGNVVEWFLGCAASGRYMEVHVSPSARWWSCVFTGIRERETPHGHPLPLSVIHHRRDKAGRHWQASVQVPARVVCQLLKARSVFDLRTNFTAMVYPVTGTALYFSLATMPGPKPNFHQPQAWLKVVKS
jgi:hypothetical protein